MTRVQILLTDDQDRRLETLARRRRVSKARLVREGVELVLGRPEEASTDSLLALVGQAGRAGRRDLSRRHDAYLAVAKRRRRQ
jgi:hypothetical protein